MAQGYVTEDGTFFESKLDAELYEAEMKLRGVLAGVYGGMNQELFFEVVLGLMPELWSYINAHQAVQTATRNQQAKEQEREPPDSGEKAEVVEGGGYVSGSEEELASLLKLPVRGPSHVPNVGRGSQSEEVPVRRKVDGA
jgi:hypothetical protein